MQIINAIVYMHLADSNMQDVKSMGSNVKDL